VSSNWLQAYLAEAAGKNICTKIGCTTCGTREFREGVGRALRIAAGLRPEEPFGPEISLMIVTGLAEISPPSSSVTKLEIARYHDAVRYILFALWIGDLRLDQEIGSGNPLRHSEIEAQLAGT
jgi:hypothetical protein